MYCIRPVQVWATPGILYAFYVDHRLRPAASPRAVDPPPYLGGLRAVQGHHGEERFLNAMANHGGPIYASYTNRF